MNLKLNQFRTPSCRSRQKRTKKNKQDSSNLWDTNDCTKTCVIVPGEKKLAEVIVEEIMPENFPNLLKT